MGKFHRLLVPSSSPSSKSIILFVFTSAVGL